MAKWRYRVRASTFLGLVDLSAVSTAGLKQLASLNGNCSAICQERLAPPMHTVSPRTINIASSHFKGTAESQGTAAALGRHKAAYRVAAAGPT